MADDAQLHHRVDELVAEEHRIRSSGHHSDEDRRRLAELEAQLDQTWDLLRQRDARRAVGISPEETAERPVGEVEGYLQ